MRLTSWLNSLRHSMFGAIPRVRRRRVPHEIGRTTESLERRTLLSASYSLELVHQDALEGAAVGSGNTAEFIVRKTAIANMGISMFVYVAISESGSAVATPDRPDLFQTNDYYFTASDAMGTPEYINRSYGSGHLGFSLSSFGNDGTIHIFVVARQDNVTEGTENIHLQLETESVSGGYSSLYQDTLGANSSLDLRVVESTATVGVAASDSSAKEPGNGLPADTGMFTFTRSGGDLTQPLTASFTVGGSATNGVDYSAIPTSVTFPANQPSVTLAVTPLEDTQSETSETATVQLVSGSAYTVGASSNATVTIQDTPPPDVDVMQVSISTLGGPAEEDNGQGGVATETLRIKRIGGDSGDLTVYYNLGGTATNGSDYTALPNSSIVIPDGLDHVDLVVTPIWDQVQGEGSETVQISLTSTSNIDVPVDPANFNVTATILDANYPVIWISTSTNNIDEMTSTGDPGQAVVTIHADRASQYCSHPVAVNFYTSGDALPGADYLALPYSVTVPGNATSATVNLTAIWDTVDESTETANVTLAATNSLSGYTLGMQTTVGIQIHDIRSSIVSLAVASSAAAEEGPDGGDPVPAYLVFTRTDGDLTVPTTVYFTGSGNATNFVDFTGLGTSITIPANQASLTVPVTPIWDTIKENPLGTNGLPVGVEGYSVALQPGAGYRVASDQTTQQFTITDAPTPVISVFATDADAGEDDGVNGANAGTWTISRTGGITQPLSITVNLTGSASPGIDYSTAPDAYFNVTIPANSASVTVTLNPITNPELEPGLPGDHGKENARLTVVPVASYYVNYDVSANTYADIWITDAPLPQVSVIANDPTAQEDSGNGIPDSGSFTLTRTGSLSLPLQVSYSMAGSSATNNTDYKLAAGSSSAGIVGNFPVGVASITVQVNPVWDDVIEGDESVVLLLNSTSTYQSTAPSNSATVTILDRPAPHVSIWTTANAQEEGTNGDPVQGAIRISRDGSTTTPLTVYFDVNGSGNTATKYVDYTGSILNGSAVIPTGASYVDVFVNPIQDTNFNEQFEHVVATLDAGSKYQIFGGVADLTIADTPARLISIVSNDSDASEQSGLGNTADTATFTVYRTGNFSHDLTVSLSYSGTASVTSDVTFSTPSTSTVTIPANLSFVTVTVTPKQDSNYSEGDENLQISVANSPNSNYTVSQPNTTNIVIHDAPLPSVSVITLLSTAQEEGLDGNPVAGSFQLTRTGSTASALTVNYQTSYVVGSSAGGTDFTLSAGPSSNGAAVANFPAGVSTITVLLNPVWDEIVEGNETIQFQVAPSAAYTVNSLSNSGQVMIVDRLVPSVSIMTMNNAQEEGSSGSPVTGFVRISRTSGSNTHPLSVSYQVQASSTATPTTDYTGTILNGVAVIPAGASYVDVSVIPVQDNDYSESTENVNVALVASSKYQFFASSTSVAITNSPAPTVSLDATDPMAAEPVAGSTDTGTFTVTRVGHLTQSLTVQLNVSGTASSGTDYTSSPSASGSTLTVTFNPGETSKTITITPLADQNYQEGTENVALSVSANAAYSVVTGHQQASVSIADAPDLATIDFTATVPSETSETSTNPMYMMMGAPPPAVATLTRTGRIDQAITVQVSVAGTATPGTDYTSTPSLSGSTITVQFAPYEMFKSIQISAITDTLVEPTETVVLSISATAAYHVGTHQTANLRIHDNHPTVSVVATDNLASEPSGSYMMMPDTGTFTIYRQDGDVSQPLTVNFMLGGSASSSDYTLTADYGTTLTATTVTIPAWKAGAQIILTPISDSLTEGLELATLSISSGPDYAVGTPSSDQINIGDSAVATYVVTASDSNATEPMSQSMPDGGAFTITRLGGTSTSDTVTFSLSGTATISSDYSASGSYGGASYSSSGNSITVGQYGATVYITPNADNDWTEGDETVVLKLDDQYANSQNPNLQQATVTIHPAVNNPPVISNLSSSASILEDSSGQTLYFSVNDQETSASSLTVQATAVPAGLVSVTVGNSGMGMPGYQQLQIVPLANQNGTATITVTVTDGNGTTTSQNVQVQVTPVNDAPSFTGGPVVSANEDSGRQTIANWASSLSAGPANESSQTLSFQVTGYSVNGTTTGSLSDLFSEPPTISPSGTLSFRSATNKFGTAYLTVFMKDNGGTDNGGMDTSTPVTFSIVVGQVNHAPTGTQADLTSFEGDAIDLQLSATDLEDGTNLKITLGNDGTGSSSLPSGLTFDQTGRITGTISNTAAETRGGHYFVLVTVEDTMGMYCYITFNWTILPPPPPQININATVSEVAEVKPSVVAQALASGTQLPFPTRFGYVVTRDGTTIDPLTVVVDFGGTAVYGTDFTAAPNQAGNITFTSSSVIVDFPIGVSTLSFYFDVTDDSITEKDETAVAAVVTSPGNYLAGQYSQASVTIHDNDTTDKNATQSTALMPDCGCDSKLTVAEDGATADDVHVDYGDGQMSYDPWSDFMGDIAYDEYAWLPMYFSGENPHPIISVDVQLPKSGPMPTKIDAVLRFGDASSVPDGTQGAVAASSPGYYRQQRFDVPAGAMPGSIYRISLMADATALQTGDYDYQVKITNLYGSNATPSVSETSTTVLGSTPIFNQIDSDLGNRWVIPGMSQVQKVGNNYVVLNGNGSGGKYYDKAATDSGSNSGDDSGSDDNSTGGSGIEAPPGTFSTMTIGTDGAPISLQTPGEHVEEFDPVTGMLLTRYDRLGQPTRFTYVSLVDGGPVTALSTVTLPGGRTFQYTYGTVPAPPPGETASGPRLVSLTYNNGVNSKTVTFDHDSTGLLTQINGPDPDGNGPNAAPVMKFQYNNTPDNHNQLLANTTDPMGVQKVFTYGLDDRRLRSMTIDGQSVWQLVPAEVQALTKMIPIAQAGATFSDASGESHTLQLDRFGSVLKDTDSEGNVTLYVRNANSQITQMTAPDGAVTNYTYDQYGRTLSVTYPNGQSETWVYDATLRGDEPVSHTDANGHTETFSYDSHGNTLSHRDFTGAITTYPTYITGNPTLEIQSAPGGDSSLGAIQTRLEYDPITNQISKATDLSTGKSTLHTYDPIDGSLKTDTDELGHTTTYNRDVWGRVLSMTQPDPDGPGPQLGPVTTYHYDDLGRLDTLTEPDGVVTHYQYNWQDEVTQVQTVYPSVTEIDPITQQATVHAGITTVSATTYNGMGLPVTDIDEQGNVTTYLYFSDGQVSQIIYPDPDGPNLPGQSPVESFTEDSVTRHITSHTDILGHVTTYQFDTRDRVVSQTDYLGGVTTFVLDGNGNVLSTHFQSQISPSLHYDTSYQYDGEDRVTQETDEYGHTTSYSYDNWGQLWYTTPPSPANGNPDTPVAKNEYDSQGRLIKTHDSTGRTTVYAYDDAGDQTQVTAPDGTSTQSTYDALGRKTTTKTTADGRITSYVYNTRGQLASSTDPDGVISYIAYDLFGDVSKITTVYPTPTGSTPIAPAVDTFSYDSAGNLLSETSPTGSAGYHYDLIGQLVSQTDSTGLMLEYKYDVAGRVIAIKNDADNSTTNFAYNDTALTVTETDPTGLVTKTWTDELGRTIKQVLPDGTFHTMQYPSANEQVVADALGNQTHYLYDNLDRLIKVTDALGNATSMTYDADGNIATMTDANGNTVTMAYDSEDRMTSRGWGSNVETWAYDDTLHTVTYVDILGRTTISKYDVAGRLQSVTDPLNGVTTYQYDSASRVIQVTGPDPDGSGPLTSAVTQYQYDANGRTSQITNAKNDHETFSYNSAGQVVSATDFAGHTTQFTYDPRNGQVKTVTDPLNQVTTYTYDTLGRLTQVTDPTGATTVSTYSASTGQLIQSKDADNNTTLYTYDAVGNLKTLKDPDSNLTTWTYDADNRPISEATTDGTRTYVYDRVGNLASETDRDGHKRKFDYQYVYDGQPDYELTHEKWLDAAGTTVTRDIAYQYTAHGQLTSVSDPSATDVMQYDTLGRLASASTLATALNPKVVLTYGYQPQNRQSTVSAQTDGGSDFLNTNTYDALGELVQVTQQGIAGGATVAPKRVDFAYNQVGQVSQIDRFADLNGTQPVADSAYAYRADGSLQGLTYTQATGPNHTNPVALTGYTWTYDAAGRITGFNSQDGTVTYAYDAAGQLQSAVSQNPTVQPSTTYTYDANGNRTMSGYLTAANNRVTSDGTYNYEYDHEGHRIKQTEIATGKVTSYTWDFRGRLTDITYQASSYVNSFVYRRIHYTYDGFDRLINKEIDTNGDGTYETSESYVYDGANIVLVFNSAGSVTNRYLQGPGVDQVLADEQVSSASQTPNTVLWALSDNQGTVRDWAQKNTTTGQTQIVDHIVYDAYGQIVSQTNPQTHLAATNKIRFGYTGQIWDADAKLYYYRARWYDPHIGKFTSEDPLGFAAGDTNVQRYVGNSPTNATDPSGLKIDENNANGFGYFHVYSSAGWFQDGKWIATISYKLTGPNSDSDRDLAYALAQRIDAARTAEAVYKIVHNGVHQGIDMGLRTAFEPLDFVLSAGEFIQKPTLANALQIVPFTPAIVRNVQELRGALRNVGNLPNVSPSMLSPTPGSHTPPVLQPGKTSCPNLDKSNVKKKPEYNSTSGKPPKTPDNIGAWLPYTEQQLLQMLVDRTKTPSAKDILAALKDGSLQVVTDPTLIGTVKKGGCNSGNVISIRPGLNEHDLLTTLIHEGQHAMDIRAGMPLFENASLFEKAKAEARAFGAEIAYMEANSLVKASQWNLTKMGAREAWISIANSYPDFMALSDAEFIECIGILNK